MEMSKIITGLAGALLLGTAGYILTETLQISKDIEIVKEKLDSVYANDCPYCIHALHSSLTEHPLLAPTIRKAHKHVEGKAVYINQD